MDIIGIKKHFDALVEAYIKKDDQIKSGSFSRAITAILEKHEESAITEISDLEGIRGVGPSTIKEVKEFLETGSSERLKKLTSTEDFSNTKRFKLNDFLEKTKK